MKIIYVTTPFLNDPHTNKLVLHCINDILMDFLSRNVISCYKNLRN